MPLAIGTMRLARQPANGVVGKFECTNERSANDSDPKSVRARFELFLLNKTPNMQNFLRTILQFVMTDDSIVMIPDVRSILQFEKFDPRRVPSK